jgi:nicotinate dehydrogenase subunit A
MAGATQLKVNGVERSLDCDPDTPLVYALRNDLGLKGTRFGCGTGHCGACTVLVEGKAVQSCDAPLWSAAGKEVTTIEGLAAAGHPLIAAFVDEQALQCGYCINGIVISAAALLEENPDPSDAQVAKALERHLCRCGTHVRILRAIRRAARAKAGQPA